MKIWWERFFSKRKIKIQVLSQRAGLFLLIEINSTVNKKSQVKLGYMVRDLKCLLASRLHKNNDLWNSMPKHPL